MKGDMLMASSLRYDIAKGGKSRMEMPMKINTEMFAPCGMNCMVCYKHCYTKKTRQPCGGCMTESKGKPEHCRKCNIKNCVQLKGIAYCYECSDFPCKLIKNLEKSYNQRYDESLVKNSIIVKKHSISQLMELHSIKYCCSKCGGVISLHDKVCSECEERYENN
ncbi:DUF3795 domain-containing protein [Tissierella carlieri]|uniref:DUF3795 domain-containing protein n=1 Tax=Tissierella carlieri TaxID=689904 RepID=UPI003864795B